MNDFSEWWIVGPGIGVIGVIVAAMLGWNISLQRTQSKHQEQIDNLSKLGASIGKSAPADAKSEVLSTYLDTFLNR